MELLSVIRRPTELIERILEDDGLKDQPAARDRIMLNDALYNDITRDTVQHGTTSDGKNHAAISAYSINRDGSRMSKVSAPLAEATNFRTNLPEIKETRVILVDIPSTENTKSMPGPMQPQRLYSHERDGAILGGNLVYDQRQTKNQAAFEDIQARTFDIWDLQNIWTPNSDSGSCPFYVQSNVLESVLRGYNKLQETVHVDRQVLFFGEHTLEFWKCLSLVETKLLDDKKVEVTCKFPMLPIKFAPTSLSSSAILDHSPLKFHFQRLLESDRAAAAIPQSSPSFACQMIILDLLRATVECWIVFVSQAAEKSTLHVMDLDNRSREFNILAFKEMSRIAKDLDLATRYTMDTALVSLEFHAEASPELHAQQKKRLRLIEIEVIAKTRTIKNKVDDILDTIESVSAIQKLCVEENQALSLKRLTLLATIFLPLSLASGLLSMSTRVSQLQLLWYDYAGLCSLLLFCIFVIYKLMSFKDLLDVSYETASAKYFAGFKKKEPEAWQFSNVLRTEFSRLDFSKRQARLFSGVKLLINCSFGATFVASFWTGMFRDVYLGSRVLGYGVLGWVCLRLILLIGQGWVLWRNLTQDEYK